MTFVGFGLGAIQAGLFLSEAQHSKAFGRLVVAEVDRSLLQAVRAHGGVWVNVAHLDGVERVRIAEVEVLDPRDPADREELEEAASEAAEMATAVPAVTAYEAGGAASPARVLASVLSKHAGRPQVLYAAENNTQAAEILRGAIGPAAEDARGRFQPLDTVIGKMSGVITDEAEIGQAGLAPLAPSLSRAVLVEEFNRILVDRVKLPGFRRALSVFEERDNLLPFAEAKLFGHNAIHCLLGFLAGRRGYASMSEAGADPHLMGFARAAFVLESGAALRARHRDIGDPMFSERGFAEYADDLLGRMVNPWLRDKVERVSRDPRRKLGYGDRLFGAMRLALAHGIRPVRLACGARAGAERLAGGRLDAVGVRAILESIWKAEGPAPHGPAADGLADECVRLVAEARPPEQGGTSCS